MGAAWRFLQGRSKIMLDFLCSIIYNPIIGTQKVR
nr:MAG TPA: hypothetical protein [Caudoviricetes sp.]